MNTVTLVLVSLLTLALAVMIAPGILAMNRGKILRNTALWLAIVLGLTLVYRTLGPGKFAPPQKPLTENNGTDELPPNDTPPPTGENGYNPPKE